MGRLREYLSLRRFMKNISKRIMKNMRVDADYYAFDDSHYTDTPSDTSRSLVKDQYRTKRKEA